MGTSDKISEIQAFREKSRRSDFFNHLSAISESVSALGWVVVAPTPAPYIKEMNDAGQFYTNRVLKDWKEKDANHVAWVKAWIATLTELQGYVKKNPPPPTPSCRQQWTQPCSCQRSFDGLSE